MDPVTLSILTGLVSNGIGALAARIVGETRRWLSDDHRLSLLARHLKKRAGIDLDSGTIHAFLTSEALPSALADGSASQLLLAVAGNLELQEEQATTAVAAIVWCLASSSGELGEFARHAQLVERLESINQGIGFVFGELLEEILRLRSTGTSMASADRLQLRLRELSNSLISQLELVGVPYDVAVEMERDPRLGHVVEVPIGSAVFVVGPMGSGKSASAHRWTQVAIVRSLLGEDDAIPVFLTAKNAARGTVSQHVDEHARGIGEPRERGVRLVIDGLDEVGTSEATRLAQEAFTLVRTWPNSSAALFTRPEVIDIPAGVQRIQIPELSNALVDSIGATMGVRFLAHNESVAVRQSLRRPLFAVLAAVWQSQRSDRPSSPIDLYFQLVRKSLGLNDADDDLMELALRSMGGGRVPAEVLGHERANRLLQSRLVESSPDGLAFSLALFQEWFAAKALLSDKTTIGDVLADDGRASHWRSAVALAVGMSDIDASDGVIREVLRSKPSLAPWIVEQVQVNGRPSQVTQLDDPTIERRTKSAGEIVLATLLFDQNLDQILWPHDCDLELYSHAKMGRSYCGLRLVRRENGETIEGPAAGGAVSGVDRSEPWKTWLGFVDRELQKLLDDMTFPCSHPMALAELAWSFVRMVHAESGLRSQPLSLEEPRRFAAELCERFPHELRTDLYDESGRRLLISIPSMQLPELHKTLLDLGPDNGEMTRPWPEPDNLDSPTNLVEDLWTVPTICAMERDVTLTALEIYQDVARRWMRRIYSDLPTVRSLPVRIRSRLLDDDHPGPRLGNTWSEVWEPLPPGSASEVIVTTGPMADRFEEHETLWEKWVLLRGDSASTCRTTSSHRVTHFCLFGNRPATSLAYQWLHDDLRSLKLVTSLRRFSD